jgi:hypothetical protein
LREIADGLDHVLAEVAGITAGSWYDVAVHPCGSRAGSCRNVDHGRRP